MANFALILMLIKGPHKQLPEYPINIMNMQKIKVKIYIFHRPLLAEKLTKVCNLG